MIHPEARPPTGGARDLFFFTNPERWPQWPLLPVVRRHPDGTVDYGVLYDFVNTTGRRGFSSTVLLTNVFLAPATEEALLALPREVHDTPEELLRSGWTVDVRSVG